MFSVDAIKTFPGEFLRETSLKRLVAQQQEEGKKGGTDSGGYPCY